MTERSSQSRCIDVLPVLSAHSHVLFALLEVYVYVLPLPLRNLSCLCRTALLQRHSPSHLDPMLASTMIAVPNEQLLPDPSLCFLLLLQLQGKTDQRFVDNAFKLFRGYLNVKTVLTPAQFLGQVGTDMWTGSIWQLWGHTDSCESWALIQSYPISVLHGDYDICSVRSCFGFGPS